jgi:CMP-N,N'-diacetyllegionaminic acid synthase
MIPNQSEPPTEAKKPSIVGLIPARAGSNRISHKNVRTLNGHPMIAYSIVSAIKSHIFSSIIVSTDSPEYADIARYYGAEVPFLRPETYSGKLSPDIEWIDFTLGELEKVGKSFDCFAILRPTSPFRLPETIQRAWHQFANSSDIDSLRAVEKCTQHPAKMWVIRGGLLSPILPYSSNGTPWHSTPYQDLPEVFSQNASLEIAWTRVVTQEHTIAGERIIPFITREYEGFDINVPEDWFTAEYLISNRLAKLVEMELPPYQKNTENT